MLKLWQKYGGFIHLGLKIIGVVLFWNAISNYTSLYWTLGNISSTLLGFLVIMGLAIALYSEQKSFILSMFFAIQVFALLQNATTLSQLFHLNEHIFWYHWVYSVVPILLILISLVGFAWIKQRRGALIIIVIEFISVIYNLLAISFLIEDTTNGTYSFTLYSIFMSIIGIHFSLLLAVFVYQRYYKQDAFQKKMDQPDEITFQ
jgi:hypothetical protein